MNFQDFSIIAAFINFSTMLGNVYWSFKLSSIRGSGELTNYWKAECEKLQNQIKYKDDIISHMVSKKSELKHQYQNQLALNQELKGQVNACQRIHQ